MPQSLSSVHIHAVFSTKDRRPFLEDPILRSELHAYLGGISRQMDCPALIVGGVADHVHILTVLSRKISQSDWIKEMKRVSSLYLKDRIQGFGWQSGYAMFSVDPTTSERVKAYIANQEEHHRKVSFEDEFRALLEEHSLAWDERYVWD